MQRYMDRPSAAGADGAIVSTVVEAGRIRRQYSGSLVKRRNTDAASFVEFSRAARVSPFKAWPYGHFQRFLHATPGVKPMTLERMMALRRYYRRAVNAYLAHASADSAMVLAIPRGSRQRMLVANAKLQRLRGRQGRPKKAAIIGELLWEWFASIRNSIVGRIPPRLW